MFDNFPSVRLARQFVYDSEPVLKKVEPSNDSLTQLLKDIYTSDENGVLQSDLSLYLSNKVDPRIADFIRQNLMRVQKAVNTRPELSDDDLQLLTPTSYDSVESYQGRVREFLDSLKEQKPSE